MHRSRQQLAKALSLQAAPRGRQPSRDATARPEDRQGLGFLRLGKTGVRRWGRRINEEFDPRLKGRRAAAKYDEMIANSPGLGGAMLLIQSLLSQVEITFEAPEDCPDPQAAEVIRQFYAECWRDLRTPQGEILGEWFSLVVHGFSLSEVVYKIRAGAHEHPTLRSLYCDGRIGWYDFEPRSQDSVTEWAWSGNELIGLWQHVEGETDEIYIPIAKCLHFRIPTAKRSPEGRSLLRSAHRSYHFRTVEEEYEGIGIERNLAGLPRMQLPAKLFTDPSYASELEAWEQMVRRLRFDSQDGCVIPAEREGGQETGYKLDTLQTGIDPSRAHEVIMRHRNDELLAVLSEFLALGSGPTGSWALADSQIGTLAHALGAIINYVIDAFNQQEVPRLGRLNGFDPHLLPEMRAGDLESIDLAVLGQFLAATTGAGVLTPDEKLEEHVRRLSNLPPMDRGADARSSVGANDATSILARAQALMGGERTEGGVDGAA